jgi:hypothetical protein
MFLTERKENEFFQHVWYFETFWRCVLVRRRTSEPSEGSHVNDLWRELQHLTLTLSQLK